MNFVEKQLSKLLITPEKYTPDDLHTIKNCLCFIRDCYDIDEMHKNEEFLKEFIHYKENNVSVNIDALKLKFGCI